MTYSLDMRELAVEQVRGGKTRAEVCAFFKIDRKTLYHWLRADDLRPKPHGQRKRKIDKLALAADVREYPDAYLRERAARFGVHISSIEYALKQLNIAKKNDAVCGGKSD